MFFKYESNTLFFQTTLCSSELCLTSQRLLALNSIKAAKSRKCLVIGTSFKGRGETGGPYLTDEQKQTSSCLSVWQPEGIGCFTCTSRPSISRKHGHGKANTGPQTMASPLVEGPPTHCDPLWALVSRPEQWG